MRVYSIQITNYRGRGGEINGHVLWEKLKFSESQKWYSGVMGYLVKLRH